MPVPALGAKCRNHSPDPYRARDISRADYEQLASPKGALFVGSPQQIVDKLLYEHRLFRHQRFLTQIDIGGLPFSKVARVIETLASDAGGAGGAARDRRAATAAQSSPQR